MHRGSSPGSASPTRRNEIFAVACAGDHGLGALAGVAADDAVDVAGRARRDLLDQHAVLLARRHLQADLPEEFLRREVERLQVGLDVGRQLRHAVVEARHRDAAVLVVQRRDDARQHADRVGGAAAEHAGMQVAVGAGDDHLLVEQAAQRGRDQRRCRVPHAGVADQREVALELVGIVCGRNRTGSSSRTPPRPRSSW